MNAVQLENKLFYSGATTKDKVLSVRVEEGLYSLLEELSEDWNSGSVSKTVRTLLLYYFLPMVYEEQWKQVHSEGFEKYVKELMNEGNEIELQKYKNLLHKFSDYHSDMKTIAEKMQVSEDFFMEQVEMLEQVAEKLEKVSILWKGELFEGKKKQNENEPVS
jgi:hypothetical protein